MKRFVSMMCLVIMAVCFSACSWYQITSEKPATASLKGYKSIFIGWMDLEVVEADWKNLGYESEKNWTAFLDYINETILPEYFQQWFPDKTITRAKSRKEKPSTGDQLYIKFTNAKYYQKTSSARTAVLGPGLAGHDVLFVGMSFIDVESGKELYSVNVGIKSRGGMEYSSYSIEGRIKNTIYNLAAFAYKRMKK